MYAHAEGIHTYSRVSNSRASTHLFFSVIFPDTRSYWLPHDFRNDIMARKFFSILKNWEFFNKKYIRLITHVMKIDRKRRKCSFTTFLVVFWDSCNFGYFLKNPRSTLIRCPHDFRFSTIFHQSRSLDTLEQGVPEISMRTNKQTDGQIILVI